MSGELMRRVNSSPASRPFEGQLVKQARQIIGEVQLADIKAAGSFAFAAKAMQGAVELNQVREQLSQGDPAISAMLADFQSIANYKVKNIQRGLFGDFGL